MRCRGGDLNRLGVDRIAELLDKAQDIRVLVIGDLMLDRYISGSVGRVSPEAPVPVVRVEEDSSAVGGAANVAANVVALGAGCSLVGCVGEDDAGRELRGALMALGVDLDGLVTTPDRPTTVKTRVMARHQQILRVDRELASDVGQATASQLTGAVDAASEACSAFALEDYNKGVLVPPVTRSVLKASVDSKVPSIVDPKRQRFFDYDGVTVFKPNAKELEDALGEPLRPEDGAWMESVRERLGCEHLLLTLGEQGMALQSAGADTVLLPTVARAVYDVSGAGDTVTAVLSVSLAAGATMVEASVLANHAAALEVAKAGVATVTPSEILAHTEDLLRA